MRRADSEDYRRRDRPDNAGGGVAPYLGSSANNPNGNWVEHYAVLKDGRVYDGFTGSSGLQGDEFKGQWDWADGIDFGF
jgi:hypothetical protein